MPKNKIIILEGIATSGKTSVKNELEKIFIHKDIRYIFIDEAETLMPLLHNTDSEVADTYMANILNKYLSLKKEVIIFDRLYLTHLWRTGKHIKNFKESTSILMNNNTQICFLKIPEEKIGERIAAAQSHRDEEWNKYVNTKGETQEDILAYYSKQQHELLELLKTILVPYTVFDTGNMDFERIAQICYI